MTSHTYERFLFAGVVVAIVVAAGSLLLRIPAVSGAIAPGILVPLVSAVLLATLAIQFLFLVAQFVPAGRTLTYVPLIRGDGWLFIIVATLMPAVNWNELAPLAGPALSPLRFAIPIPLIQAALMLSARMYQLRARRRT